MQATVIACLLAFVHVCHFALRGSLGGAWRCKRGTTVARHKMPGHMGDPSRSSTSSFSPYDPIPATTRRPLVNRGTLGYQPYCSRATDGGAAPYLARLGHPQASASPVGFARPARPTHGGTAFHENRGIVASAAFSDHRTLSIGTVTDVASVPRQPRRDRRVDAWRAKQGFVNPLLPSAVVFHTARG